VLKPDPRPTLHNDPLIRRKLWFLSPTCTHWKWQRDSHCVPLNYDTITSETNNQIANRVQPKLTDLIAALATGAVASIALVRKDIADALPGVAIAISLVPPLCVVALTECTNRVPTSYSNDTWVHVSQKKCLI